MTFVQPSVRAWAAGPVPSLRRFRTPGLSRCSTDCLPRSSGPIGRDERGAEGAESEGTPVPASRVRGSRRGGTLTGRPRRWEDAAPAPRGRDGILAPRRRTPMEPTIPAALSRRAALAGLGASGLGLALAARPISAAAQEASPTATAAALPPLVAEWQAAVASHNLDRILALFTPDGIWEEVPLNVFAQGQDAIRAHLQGVFAATADIAYAVASGFATGDRMAAEWTVSGTVTGDFPGLPP